MVRKTGIVPNGLVNVKNEVKQSKAKGRSVLSMIISYFMQN
ncbi:hypothetical protein HMPREF2532_03265 [Bacteroides ovatus]|uniref:Uncharacterized protein n=1 Tax=Bacteroides ovatus (strain ATCC 8483 / DSM 1896 / JCM 5824 / BCRC 10623 / CCUG 4943 / NCTC 11153) TaxID=411476 RepID=A0AAN3A6Z0_BACO1|nr:hypothetical protein BACOVA_03077 [Bacteroides ovatus ATCC 8483]KXT45070.1 hypothetical protein HMPREF2532_03265 [Bacteroides ovatus]